jgi:hypothetical protein
MMAGVWEADSHDVIEVRDAWENNLKEVSVKIPKRRMTVSAGFPARESHHWCSARSPLSPGD